MNGYHLKKIVDIQLGRLRARLGERKITLEIDDAASEHLMRVSHDPAYGARPLERIIQRELGTALGRKLLGGKLRDGQTVEVGFDDAAKTLTFGVA